MTTENTQNTEQTIQVGDGATICFVTDRYPATVVDVSESMKTVSIQQDISRPTKDSDYFGDQSHIIERDEDAPVEVFTLRKNGCYVKKGSNTRYGTRLVVGSRRRYTDPHF